MEELEIGILISIIALVSGLSYTLYRDSKGDNKNNGFTRGKTDTLISSIQDELTQMNNTLLIIQKQVTDIRERLARLEGPTK